MTILDDAFRQRLERLVFKTSELTAGEAITAQKAARENDMVATLQFVTMRIEGNDESQILKPSELWTLPLSEVGKLVERARAALPSGPRPVPVDFSKLTH